VPTGRLDLAEGYHLRAQVRLELVTALQGVLHLLADRYRDNTSGGDEEHGKNRHSNANMEGLRGRTCYDDVPMRLVMGMAL